MRTSLLILLLTGLVALPAARAQSVASFENCPPGPMAPGGCGAGEPWSAGGGTITICPTGALTPPVSGFPSDGARWCVVDAGGATGALQVPAGGPAPYPFTPNAAAKLSLPVQIPAAPGPGGASISFDWNFVTPECPASAGYNDFVTVDLVSGGTPVLNLLYVDTFSVNVAAGAVTPNAAGAIVLGYCSFPGALEATPLGTPKTVNRAIPPALYGASLTFEVHVGNGGDALYPSWFHLDDLRLPGAAAAPAAEWQVNQPNSATDFNGVLATATAPGIAALGMGAPGVLRLRSLAFGNLFEAGAVLAPAVPFSGGGSATPHAQTVNLDTAMGLTFLNGGAFPSLIPFAADLTLPFSAPPSSFIASLQMLVLDASHPDGFSLSQASELRVVPSGDEIYTLPLAGLTASLRTSLGDQFTTIDGQLTLRIGRPGPTGIRQVTAEDLSFTSAGVSTAGGPSGGISWSLRPETSTGTWDITTGNFNLALDWDVGSPRIDEAVPPVMGAGDGCGMIANHRELWRGFLQGAAFGDLSGALQFSGMLTSEVIGPNPGGVRAASAPINGAIPRRDVAAPCPEERRTRTRTIKLRPVIIKINAFDQQPTGSGYNVYRAAADTQWAKCCVQFEWLTPTVIFTGPAVSKDLVNVGLAAGMQPQRDLLATVDPMGANDEIEVFFVRDMFGTAETYATATPMNPAVPHAWGDGVCWGSGQRSAKVIVADRAVAGLPIGANPSPNVLAHELGHVLNHGHPAGGGPRDHASYTNTIMHPGGNPPNIPATNPGVVTRFICSRNANPLLVNKAPAEACCYSWDPQP